MLFWYRNASLSPKNIASLLAVWVLSYLLSGCGSSAQCDSSAQNNQEEQALENLDVSQLKMSMLADIASTIYSDHELDNDVKADIARMAITPLRKSSEIQIVGKDSVTRPIAVSFQKAFEQSVLTMVDEQLVSQVTAIIHTRKPTTPLCNPPGEALPQTMHPDMHCDPKRCKTIQDRTITLREMASRGKPLDLYVAYLEDGLEKRSAEEQKIYRQELANPKNTSLHDMPLTCSNMPDEIVGASYILKTSRGNSLYFANNGTQAIDGKGDTNWNYWFGNLKEAPVNQRYQQVVKYLKDCGMSISL